MAYRRYGTRVGSFRSRRRSLGKRKSFRRVSSRKVVTRKMLRRAIAPLKPELKHIDFVNYYSMAVGAAPSAITASSFVPTAVLGTLLGDGTYGINQTDFSSPIFLTDTGNNAGAMSRVGRKIAIKGIDIHCTVGCLSQDPDSKPFYVRVFVFRSNSLPQFSPNYTNALGSTGASYPHFGPMASAAGPCWWYLQTNDTDSFPSFEHTLGGRRDVCQLVGHRRVKMCAQVQAQTGNAVGTTTVTSSPTDGVSRAYMHFRISPKHKTMYNLEDLSKTNGYAQYGHYWIVAMKEATPNDTTLQVGVNEADLRWRVRYTDA